MVLYSVAPLAARRSPPSAPAWLAAPVLLLLWILALHRFSYGLRGADDGFYVEVAHLWLSGAAPYAHAFDVKPPGYFVLLALAETIFGPTQAALNALTAFCETATALCLLRLGRQFAGLEAGVFAAVGYPALSQMFANNPGYPPLEMATAFAFVLATAPFGWRRRVVLSGLAMGFAFTIKQTAALEGLALLWLLLRDPEAETKRLRTALLFATATLAAPLALALVLAAQGALAPLINDVVFSALRRPGLEGDTLAQAFGHFDSVQQKVLPLIVVAIAGAVRLRSLASPTTAGRTEGPLLWLIASWIELLLNHARWLIYLGPTLAPLLLLASASPGLVLRAPTLRAVALAAVLLIELGVAYPFRMWRFLDPSDEASVSAAARIIVARHPAPQDRLLAIMGGEELNYVVDIAPPTPYFHWMHLICTFPGAGYARLRESLAAKPRFIVAPVHPFRPYCESPQAWPTIEAALAKDYRLLAVTPAQAPALPLPLRVYERVAAQAAPSDAGR